MCVEGETCDVLGRPVFSVDRGGCDTVVTLRSGMSSIHAAVSHCSAVR